MWFNNNFREVEINQTLLCNNNGHRNDVKYLNHAKLAKGMGAKTLCYSGARVQDITGLLPTVLRQILGADAVIVHVGSNDIRKASSELLKMYF